MAAVVMITTTTITADGEEHHPSATALAVIRETPATFKDGRCCTTGHSRGSAMEGSMTVSYVALIRKEPSTDYWVDIPDIPGCVASGATIEEAKMHFARALKQHLDGTKEDGLSLQPPHSREQVLAASEDPAIVESYVIEIEPF